MAGYTRQSIADIINGSEVTAPPLNAEFNQMAAAFAAASGHSHDGSTGNAPKIDLTTSVAGYLPAVHGGTGGKSNNTATTNPTATDDASEGYAPMSMWENTTTGRVFICVGNTNNAAVWRELVQVQTGNKIIPEATDTVDLGEPATRFQDLWLSGGLSAFGNGSLGGTLSVTGATALSSTLAVTGNTTVGGTLGVTGDTTVANLTATGTTTITSGDINSGAMDGTTIGASTPAAGTFTNLTANTSLTAATADINGGTIDNATIGATTPSTGAFTTISTSGQATLASADINGGSIDGATIGATSHTSGKFSTLQSTGNATLATADINGGTIDGTAIGSTTASSGAFTTVSATGGITGDLTGDVTGNVTGNVTGAITGNVTGNLTGNVTSSGTSTFNNVTIDGTLNMNAGTTATITNLTTPTNANDAATKGYVDTSVADLVDAAPGTLDTLNELAAALNDDPNFSTTITNSIATKLPLAGGTMSGAIAMGGNKVTGVTDPTAAQDAATKAYVDQQDGLQVSKSGDTMSGNLAMGSNKVTGLAAPTDANDATSKTYVDGILGSATAAAASASAAATSESNAATSETNAANSASSAAADLSSVQSLYDQFDDRYLGSKASAPTVDNDGNALLSGALYFNNTTNLMYVYGSAGWVPAGSSVNGTSDRVTYTASAGQTVFAATYDAGYVDVYLNGVKLVDGSDFTATNGTSVVLTTGAAINDIIDIVAYGTFTLADHYTKTQTDARYVEVAGDTMTGNLDVTGTVTADGLTVENSSGAVAKIGRSDTAIALNDVLGQLDFTTNDASTTEPIRGQMKVVSDGTSGNSSLYVSTASGNTLSSRIKVDFGGDISFYEDTGTTPKFFWDASAEALGIRTSSPSAGLSINAATNGAYAQRIGVDDPGTGTASSVKIGFDVKAIGLNPEPAAFIGVEEASVSSVQGALTFATRRTNNNTVVPAEAMRIDSSGNLLVGKTADNWGTTGVQVHGYGVVAASRNGHVINANRETTDGDIARFQKDGSTVGSIGTNSGYLYIGSPYSTDSHIAFLGGEISPVNSGGGSRDAAISLGAGTRRFKDLYLSGGVYLGGTGSANKLDDYEEGTWSPRYSAATGGQIGGSQQGVGTYTKIGNTVNVRMYLYISNISVAGFSGSVSVINLPFTVVSSYMSSAKTTTTQSSGTYGAFATAPTHAAVNTGATSISLFKPLAGQVENKLQVSDFATASGNRNYVAFDITYQVA